MRIKVAMGALCAFGLMFGVANGADEPQKPYGELGHNGWFVHDDKRPEAKVVTPGLPSTLEKAGTAPSDAIVLFDGKDLSNWVSDKDGTTPPTWTLKDGAISAAPKSGDIRTKQGFGSCQLHIEFATPSEVKGDSQGRGNSGIFLMGKYEVQVLDGYNNKTYADGQVGSIYGQKPPEANVARKPGEWQMYDIVFHRPVFEGDKVVKPATVTVFLNGVLVQDNWQIQGSTFHKRKAAYEPHPDKQPLKLQDHSNPTQFRNIWIRELSDEPMPNGPNK
jgi:hypothetical protein